ncbi:MAG: hypothetical protein M3040_09645 [Bacteroidota bacterium]|nr:hypothetical protein [Bacteroidota bacterium]
MSGNEPARNILLKPKPGLLLLPISLAKENTLKWLIEIRVLAEEMISGKAGHGIK